MANLSGSVRPATNKRLEFSRTLTRELAKPSIAPTLLVLVVVSFAVFVLTAP